MHTEIDIEVFTSNLAYPALNQVSTNVFNGTKYLQIWDPVHKVYVNPPKGIAQDPLSYTAPQANDGNYHTYKFEWFPSWINFYVDGKHIRTVTNPNSLPVATKDQKTSPQPLGPSHEYRSCLGRLDRKARGRSLARARTVRPWQDLLR